ncbi:MAG: hypothetical protein CVV44_05245 [Spirochaetae bacterium HGW-Spirochaetae-1]|nr:MAG: hypothetical protein CVV44_05245 [Spirochaetae bacterium HGW-Spirochaetae-1]
MDQNALIVWNFLFLAYKNGLLEKNLQVLQGILDPHIDLSLVLGSMEDNLSVADRTNIDVAVRDKALPLLQFFSDENFIRGVGLLLDIFQPVLEKSVREAGYDLGKVMEKANIAMRFASSLKPLTVFMAPVIIDYAIAQKPSWTTRLVLRRMKKKILKAKGDIIS